jgi:hypothetical protein
MHEDLVQCVLSVFSQNGRRRTELNDSLVESTEAPQPNQIIGLTNATAGCQAPVIGLYRFTQLCEDVLHQLETVGRVNCSGTPWVQDLAQAPFPGQLAARNRADVYEFASSRLRHKPN